jgi:hypothetical protein
VKSLKLAFLFALCASSWAQTIGSTGPFAGPTILTNGVGGVGRRAGQDVNLRFFGNVSGIYDTGLTPFATKDGQLASPDGQYGMEAGLGAYGTHNFRRSAIGVDYNGNFRHYASASNYDGSNQQLAIGYTAQLSRRWLIDMREGAGTQSYGATLGTDVTGTPATGTVDTSSLLFDNRTNYLQTQFNARYLLNRRTVVTMGGSYYTVHRQARQLVGVNGYNLTGSIQHQLTRRLIISAQFQHLHYDYPRVFGESDINYYVGQLHYQIGRSWQVGLGGGAFSAETQGIQTTSLDPTLSALLGVDSVQTAFYKKSLLPVAMASISRQFRKSSLGANFNTSVTPGNGVYLTSQQRSINGSYSYNGISRLGLSVTLGSIELQTIGQTLQNYRQLNGTANVSYRVGKSMNLVATYMRRHQDILNNPFLRNSSRVSIGIYFSPGEIPLSFH